VDHKSSIYFKKSIWKTFLICLVVVVVLIAVGVAYIYYELHTSFKLFFPLGPPSHPFQMVPDHKNKPKPKRMGMTRSTLPSYRSLHWDAASPPEPQKKLQRSPLPVPNTQGKFQKDSDSVERPIHPPYPAAPTIGKDSYPKKSDPTPKGEGTSLHPSSAKEEEHHPQPGSRKPATTAGLSAMDKKRELQKLVEQHLPDQRATFTKEQFQDFVDDYLRLGEADYENDAKLLTTLIEDYTKQNWNMWNRFRLLKSFNKHQAEIQQWFQNK
jgi:hypothetical protein